MHRLYYRVYYHYYVWSARVNGEDEYPQYVALMVMIVVTYFNMITVLFSIDILFGMRLLDLVLTQPAVLLSLALISGPHYVLLVHKKRYKKIRDEFDNGKGSSIKGTAVTWGYTFGSVLLLFALIFLKAWMNNQVMLKQWQ